jgi:hypothetical protein
MKFRYYVTDSLDGVVKGTNDSEVARSYADSEDHFVVDSNTGVWLQTNGDIVGIEEIT